MSSFAAHYINLLTTLAIFLQHADSIHEVPCMFVFGDSLSDNGNNNDLPTSAKVNYYPYGIDFYHHEPTGRFSNGQNLVDVIGKHLGYKESVPPFASIGEEWDNKLFRGVNYASGSAGIRSETGIHLGERIPLDQQLMNHGVVIESFTFQLGDRTSSHLEKCLYMLNIGSNDYINNYFMPEDDYYTSKVYSIDEYAEVLIKQYTLQIETLYEMGARKMALFKLGPFGCTPYAIKRFGFAGKKCSLKMNVAATAFNVRLHKLVDRLNRDLEEAIVTCINSDVIYVTSTPDFPYIFKPCCEVREDGQCENDSVPCSSRKSHVFFDNFHPTEAFNRLMGSRAYQATTPLDAHPFDIRTLVTL